MVRILGSSITALVIAQCLSYKKEKYFINADTFDINPLSVLWLEYENEKQKDFYSTLFEVENIQKYTKHVKIGYLFNNKIYDVASHEMISTYLNKQSRSFTKSSMSDGKTEQNVILLNELIPSLIKKQASFLKKNDFYDFTYDTIDKGNIICKKPQFEYICKNDSFLMNDYDIIYDCNVSDVKRYTKNYVEYITKPTINAIKIPNYYDEPTLYLHENTLLIGRNATKTQFKQKDVIDYLIYGKGIVKNV